MKVAFKGYDLSGRAVSGVVETAGLGEAAEQLRRQGTFATTLKEEIGGVVATPGKKGERLARGPKRLRNVASFTRQLSILVSTHTPLVQGLAAVEKQAEDEAWKGTIADLRRRVEEGASLAQAMDSHGSSFDAICRSMVAAGESGGKLDVMLRGLAQLVRQQLHVRRSVVGAMIYPCVLITVSLAVLGVMIVFVLPQFQGLFETLHAPMPPTTKVLMGFAGAIRGYWWAFLAGGVGAVAGVMGWVRSEGGAGRMIDTVLTKAPRIGPITRSFATARIARVMGVLLDAKIPMLEALILARQGTSNRCYVDLLTRAEEAVSRGESLADVFSESPLIVPSVCQALSSGERSGKLGAVLVQVADYLDEDNEVLVRALTSILEPLILAVLGVIIGFVAVSMFLPLFDLTALNGGGES